MSGPARRIEVSILGSQQVDRRLLRRAAAPALRPVLPAADEQARPAAVPAGAGMSTRVESARAELRQHFC
jgi:hypothetical protein